MIGSSMLLPGLGLVVVQQNRAAPLRSPSAVLPSTAAKPVLLRARSLPEVGENSDESPMTVDFRTSDAREPGPAALAQQQVRCFIGPTLGRTPLTLSPSCLSLSVFVDMCMHASDSVLLFVSTVCRLLQGGDTGASEVRRRPPMRRQLSSVVELDVPLPPARDHTSVVLKNGVTIHCLPCSVPVPERHIHMRLLVLAGKHPCCIDACIPGEIGASLLVWI
jgi:hypothetical protein